jgi:hypothetical protein
LRTTTVDANRVAVGDTQVTVAERHPTAPWTRFGLFGAVARPVSVTWCVCGATAPVSLTARTAVRRPTADGVNVTRIVQVAFGCSVVPVHLSAERRKFFGFAPPSAVPVIGIGLFVRLRTVTTCAGEAVPAGIGFLYVTLAGENPTDDGVPVPETFTV